MFFMLAFGAVGSAVTVVWSRREYHDRRSDLYKEHYERHSALVAKINASVPSESASSENQSSTKET